MNAPRLAAVVVTYNSAAVLGQCLESLRDGGADGVELVDVVVVDNASNDNSTEIAESFDGLPIKVVQLIDNAGYAAGLNAGVSALGSAPPEAVMVLNPDCRLRPGALAALAAALHAPGRGIAAPRLLNPDETLQPSLRRCPTIAGVFAESILGGRMADRLRVGELIFSEGPHARPGPSAWATGAALLLSWSVLEEVGRWDESFLLYSEETEYLLKARDLGWTTWYEPAAVIEHIGGESDTRPDLAALLTVNRARLFKRRRGATSGFVYAAGLVLGTTIRAAVGQPTARAALAALLFPSRRITSLAELK